jgi:hypothetical protein
MSFELPYIGTYLSEALKNFDNNNFFKGGGYGLPPDCPRWIQDFEKEFSVHIF